MRVAILSSEPVDVATGSGTAVAVTALRGALRLAGIESALITQADRRFGGTVARWRFNRSLEARLLNGYDAVLGVNGDGWKVAASLSTPYVPLVKALYAGASPHEHGATRRLIQQHARWECAGVNSAVCVVAPSHFAAARVSQLYGVAAHRVRVIAEPFDTSTWRAQLPPPSHSEPRVLCVAHLYPRKRIGDLLDAWPAVEQAVPSARLDIVGDGPQLRLLAARAQGMQRVFLHGHLEPFAVRQMHARSSVFCLPSAQETFGYAAVEALATGLPLVIADAGALPEVCDGAVALRVAVGDIAGIAAALVRCLSDDSLAADAAVRNPKRALEFAPVMVGGDFAALLESLHRREDGSESRNAGSPR